MYTPIIENQLFYFKDQGITMDQENEAQTPRVTIKDRRRFADQGPTPTAAKEEIKMEPEKSAAKTAAEKDSALDMDKSSGKSNATSSESSNDRSVAGAAESSAEISFSTFIISLATQASMQMGIVPPHPDMPISVDYDAAKQTIDILGLIEAKTKGNLESDESKLLKNILHELRLGFMSVVRK